MKIFTSSNAHSFEYELKQNGEEQIILKDGRAAQFDLQALGNGRYALLIGNRSYLVHMVKQNDMYHVHVGGAYFAITVEDERTRKLKEMVQQSASGPKEQVIKTPIPGLVLKVEVEKGQSVAKGDPLLVLEAMKMENVIKAPCACTVAEIAVEPQQTVQQDQKLLTLVAE